MDIDLLDSDDPFEIDMHNRPHLYSHPLYGVDDLYDVWFGQPLFYPARLPAHWLMVGAVPGATLVAPLAPPNYSDETKTRPIGVYEASDVLTKSYNDDLRGS